MRVLLTPKYSGHDRDRDQAREFQTFVELCQVKLGCARMLTDTGSASVEIDFRPELAPIAKPPPEIP